MIQSRQDLQEYLDKDRFALGIPKGRRPRPVGDDIWKYEIALRHREYCTNCPRAPLGRLRGAFWAWRHARLGIRLGYTIPVNVFGPGLRINHVGTIIVNKQARIGAFCDIHCGVNIGPDLEGRAPALGDNVWIGPGAKIFGGIAVGDNTMIGANAVVNRSFPEGHVTLGGIPAGVISEKETPYRRTEQYGGGEAY